MSYHLLQMLTHLLQGSWKTKLRDRFKFLRRPHISDCNDSPPSKRRKIDKRIGSNPLDDDPNSDSFEENLAVLTLECRKKKRDRSIANILRLTAITYTTRRKWIIEQQPTVSEVLEKYPSLDLKKVVSVFVCTASEREVINKGSKLGCLDV